LDTLTETEVGELRFGRALRLGLCRWVLTASVDRFYQSEAVVEMPPRMRTAVPTELARLVDAGLLEEEPGEAGQRRKYFRRTDSALWRIIQTSDEVLKEFEAKTDAKTS